MATEPVARPQGWPERNAQGYEHSDVRVRWIGVVVLFLIVGAIAIHFTLGLQLRILGKSSPTRDAWSGATRPVDQELPAKGPKLQISPPMDLAKFRYREDAELNSYGWINKTQGLVRIPIHQAMNLIVEKNLLPVRIETNVPPTGPSVLQLQQERTVNAEGVKK